MQPGLRTLSPVTIKVGFTDQPPHRMQITAGTFGGLCCRNKVKDELAFL
jgi:hypothetical protein